MEKKRFFETKGQSSVEFMVIAGFLLVVLLIGVVSTLRQSDSAVNSFKRTATRTALQDISSAAKDIYHQGSGARRTVPTYFPSGVSNISFQDNSLIAEFSNGERISEYVGFNLTGNLTPDEGNALVKLDSYGSYVYVQPIYQNYSLNITPPAPPETQPPSIAFEQPTPANGATLSVNFTYINSTVLDNVSVAAVYLEWNGTNESMLSSGSNYYLNKTNLANGNYSYRIYASDTSGNWNVSETRTLRISVVAGGASTAIRWATLNGPADANAVGAPDNVYDTTINGNLYAYRFNVTDLSGTIINVTLIWSHQIPGNLSVDSVNLNYGLTAYNDMLVKVYNINNTPVDKLDNVSTAWEYIYNVSRPGGGAWQWSDFASLMIGGHYTKISAADSLWRLDAVGVNITYS